MGWIKVKSPILYSQKGYKFVINDPVVVYLKNGSVVSGLLLAKSLDMVMLQTESGNLTIPKQDLIKNRIYIK